MIKSLPLCFHWRTILHNLFPSDNPDSAMTRKVQDTAYTIKNKVLSLLVTAPKPPGESFFSLLKIPIARFILF